ncbi:MAG TPA: YceI family protein [Acidimicrobiales bacterium]|nr:YceI family protein [Acidimicrobiales bacterium]
MTEPYATTPATSGPRALLQDAGTWVLEPGSSSVRFTHKTMWRLLTVKGRFDEVRGSAEVAADGSVSGHLEIDAASLTTKNAKRDAHLRGPDFFDAAAHPRIVFSVVEVSAGTGDEVVVAGTLEVAGQRRPVTLRASVDDATPEAVTLRAETALERADFAMTWNQLGMMSGSATVSVAARFRRRHD